MSFEQQIPLENSDDFNIEQEKKTLISLASEIRDEEAVDLAERLNDHEVHARGAAAVMFFALMAHVFDVATPETNNFFSQSLDYLGAVPKWTFLANLLILSYEGVAAHSIKEQITIIERAFSPHTKPYEGE